MNDRPVQREVDDAGVQLLVLNRPDARNALDDELTDALAGALDDAAGDARIRAIILTGAGGSFCAGGDLSRFEREWTPSAFRRYSHRLTALIAGIEQLEKPVIAAINGAVTGAGTQLALACDIRLAAPGAQILFSEGRLGIIPSHGGVTRLVKLVGLARARDVLLAGEVLGSEDAERFGLLTAVVADGEVVKAARERAELALRRSPEAYAAAKRLLAIAADASLQAGIAAEALAQTSLISTSEHREAVHRAVSRRRDG
ncbi:MAG: enoyl-CoA hydratase/isomerase family protein [Solirubrobacterales bacterium]|nr:enoyl-CoA hydratase/isomerase family protein [Solirubrobacterales bacterium]